MILYDDYINYYKKFHHKISEFYGDLTPETYNKYIELLKYLLKEEEKEKKLKKNPDKILEGFCNFNIQNDLKTLDKIIVKELTRFSFYEDLNRWLRYLNINNFEIVAYFTSRLMYSLNSLAQRDKTYCENNKKLYIGTKKTFTSLLPYQRAKGKIISLSSFISTSESDIIGFSYIKRQNPLDNYKTNLTFQTYFTIINKLHNAIDIHNYSLFKEERENLFQPFSFYYVRDVKIDIKNYTAEIYLESIEKTEIFEKKIKSGKEIEYNLEKHILQIKK